MKEILSKETYQQESDFQQIRALFSKGLVSGQPRETLIREGRVLLQQSLGQDIQIDDIHALSAGILSHTVAGA